MFNRLVERRAALVTDMPGLTRDRIYGEVRKAKRPFRLVDTGGLRWDDVPFGREILMQAEAALSEAALVLFVLDGRSGPTALDEDVAAFLRRKGAKTLLVANKVDTGEQEDAIHALHALGLGDPIGVSAEHARNLGDLLDAIDERLPDPVAADGDDAPAEPIKVALIGRPNVGKSSLLNRLVGEERMVVSDLPGTTRDAVDTLLALGERRYLLVDTAGLKKRGRQSAGAEALSAMRARQAIERADVVVLVLDGSQPIAAQDAHIAGYATESARPIVVAVNKWDLVESRESKAKEWERSLRERLRFVKGVPFVFVSAQSGQRVVKILDRVDEVFADSGKRVPTPALNDWLQEESAKERSAPAKGGTVRLFYATQTGVRPPRFVVFCNEARKLHFSLRRHLENSLRDRFGFGAAPIRMTFRSRRERAAR